MRKKSSEVRSNVSVVVAVTTVPVWFNTTAAEVRHARPWPWQSTWIHLPFDKIHPGQFFPSCPNVTIRRYAAFVFSLVCMGITKLSPVILDMVSCWHEQHPKNITQMAKILILHIFFIIKNLYVDMQNYFFFLSTSPLLAIYHVIYDETLFYEWIMRK